MGRTNNPPKSKDLNGFEIAIVGMAGRFPGAKNVAEFWRNLRDGVESITRFSDEELIAAGVDPVLLSDPDYVKAWSVLADVESFDAEFFGFAPREAETMDPQHRLFLECAWEALEDAGYDSENSSGPIAVYAGAGTNSYLLHNLQFNGDLIRSPDVLQMIIGSDKDYLTTRVSYKLNLTGPSVTVQTACSTSLVAVHLACQSLLAGECDMALAGGVTIRLPQIGGYLYQEGSIFSPDGHCRAFDARAQGTLWGSGVGIVVLKRLEDALADGDHIYAVIKGTAINNDGALKIGYTAPSIGGQARMIARALAMADVASETVSYIEAHGTGTRLGDPIELAALTQAFRSGTEKKGFCSIGSLKTNIGHLGAAAGVTGLIKTALALTHKELPPSLHFERPNPRIEFADSPFYVQTALSEWKADKSPRRAGVSSLGIGGTNAHAVLEEAPASEPSGESRSWKLVLLSAKTSAALERATENLLAHFKKTPDLNLADAAYTLQVGRKRFSHRRMLVCRDVDDALAALEASKPKRLATTYEERTGRSVAFMFPGQGSQYTGMGRDLYRFEPVFREQVDLCSELLRPQLKIDLREVLYPGEQNAAEANRMLETCIAQPALFVVEYAIAKLWMAWGVHPDAMIGHSIGEYVAACLAGVFSLEDALALLAARGRLMQRLPGGAMLAVPMRPQEIRPLLGERLSLAAINESRLCVVSGPTHAVELLQSRLAEQGFPSRRLRISHAFQSRMMDPILEPFTDEVRRVKLKQPRILYLSNVTGTWITAAEATSSNYWARHLRHTVRFAEGVQELLKDPNRILLEVGPGQTLSGPAKRYRGKASGQVVFSSLRRLHDQGSESEFLLQTLGELWLAGKPVDWAGFSAHERRRRVPLPTYPFERQRYWIEPQKREHSLNTRPASHTQRQTLRAAGQGEAEPNETFVAPRNELESVIAQIWREVLGVDRLSVHDDFFKLGGHSLLATQIIARVRKALHVELPLRSLFDLSTVAELAATITEKASEKPLRIP